MTHHRIYSTDHFRHLHSDSKQHILLLVSGPSYPSRNDDLIFGVSKKYLFTMVPMRKYPNQGVA